jgi:hypothetical protein
MLRRTIARMAKKTPSVGAATPSRDAAPMTDSETLRNTVMSPQNAGEEQSSTPNLLD